MKRTTVTPRIVDLEPSFYRHLRAQNLSPKTEDAYRYAIRDMTAFLERSGMPTGAASVTREHLESWMGDLLARRTPGTALAYFKGAQQFWRWVEDDAGEVPLSPMAKMRPPRVGHSPPPVLREDQVRALLAACSGNTFEDRRDAAIIRVLYDTGIRLAELCGIRWMGEGHEDTDIDLDQRVIRVRGKGNRIRWVPLGHRAVKAVDRYLWARGRHPHAEEGWLWLGRKGRMRESGVQQMLRRRGREAGIGKIGPHIFRHSFSHAWRTQGGDRDDLKAIGGWQSDQMLARYGASAAAERAREAHRRLSPGDRL